MISEEVAFTPIAREVAVLPGPFSLRRYSTPEISRTTSRVRSSREASTTTTSSGRRDWATRCCRQVRTYSGRL